MLSVSVKLKAGGATLVTVLPTPTLPAVADDRLHSQERFLPQTRPTLGRAVLTGDVYMDCHFHLDRFCLFCRQT